MCCFVVLAFLCQSTSLIICQLVPSSIFGYLIDNSVLISVRHACLSIKLILITKLVSNKWPTVTKKQTNKQTNNNNKTHTRTPTQQQQRYVHALEIADATYQKG